MSKPQIRFEGFSENWEQRELKNVSNFIRGSFPQPYTNPEWYDEVNGKPFVQVADIGFDLKLNETTKLRISKIAESKSRFVDKGTVIVALQGSIETSIGRVAITQYPAYFDRTILIFESYKIEMSKQYFAQIIKKLFEREKEKAWGATISTITKEALSDFVIGVPNFDEQKRIGMFLQTVDATIALHNQEHEKTKNFKKAMLEKMFPKAGSKVPEIRFEGFSEEWEERKLGEIADIIGGGTPDTNIKEYWDGNIDWYSPAEIGEQIYVNNSQKKITESGLEKSSAKILPGGAILFTSRAGIGNSAILVKEGATNQGFQSILPYANELDSYFIFSRTFELKNYAETVGAGSTFVEVSGKQMEKMVLLMPTLEEQIVIGNFFKNLDETISLQKKQIEHLQNVKKALLEKMFV